MLYTSNPETQSIPTASSSSSSRRSSPSLQTATQMGSSSSSSKRSSPGRTQRDVTQERGRYSPLEKLLMAACVATLLSNVILWVVGLAIASVWVTRML